MELTPEEPQKTKSLFDAVILDMYQLSEKILTKEFNIAKENVSKPIREKKGENYDIKNLEDKSYFQTAVLDSILFSLETNSLENRETFNFVKKFISSAISLIQEKYDEISLKNIYSLVIYGYTCLECFSYLLKTQSSNDFPRGSFKPDNYTNLNSYLLSNKQIQIMKSVYNSFRDNFFTGKKKSKKEEVEKTIRKDFLNLIENYDFKKDCEDFTKRKETKDAKNQKNSNEKEKSNEKKSSSETKEKNIRLENLFDIKESLLKDEKIPKKLIDTIDLLFNEISSLTNQLGLKSKESEQLKQDFLIKTEQLEKKTQQLEEQLEKKTQQFEEQLEKNSEDIQILQRKNEILMNNQKKLWNYLNLLSNGRDMIKSIIYYLYNYFEMKGEKDAFNQLKEIMQKLGTKELDSKINNIDKSKLEKFLLLSFFLKNFLNKVLHREFVIEDIQNGDNNEEDLKLMSEYSFTSFFINLEKFIEQTILENDVQKMISQAYKDYIADGNLPDVLKYQEGKIFEENGGKHKPVLNRSDIDSVFNFLNKIKINEKSFGTLCENKIWKKDDGFYENLPIPIFFNSNSKIEQ